MSFDNKLKGERQSAEEIFRQKKAERKVNELEEKNKTKVEKTPDKKEEEVKTKDVVWGCLWLIVIVIAIVRLIMWIF